MIKEINEYLVELQLQEERKKAEELTKRWLQETERKLLAEKLGIDVVM